MTKHGPLSRPKVKVDGARSDGTPPSKGLPSSEKVTSKGGGHSASDDRVACPSVLLHPHGITLAEPHDDLN